MSDAKDQPSQQDACAATGRRSAATKRTSTRARDRATRGRETRAASASGCSTQPRRYTWRCRSSIPSSTDLASVQARPKPRAACTTSTGRAACAEKRSRSFFLASRRAPRAGCAKPIRRDRPTCSRPEAGRAADGQFVGRCEPFGVTSRMTAYLTVREVATMARCEHKSVRRAIAAGKLRAFQPANKLLIREDDAHAWIEGRPVSMTGSAPILRPAPSRRRPTLGSQRPGSVDDLREIERKAVRA